MELHTVRTGEEIITYNTAMAWVLNNSQYMTYYKTVTSIDHVHEEKNTLKTRQAIKKTKSTQTYVVFTQCIEWHAVKVKNHILVFF